MWIVIPIIFFLYFCAKGQKKGYGLWGAFWRTGFWSAFWIGGICVAIMAMIGG
ncbi:hypothetical protein [Ralstonia phage RSP15]|uniref:hypothetical protein n=1 Tax=Ralstonia phage RSP15 TaxID=1785960 RepID=UPI00074D2E0F|nr:hypothetical protein BH754_gp086 [Ralstonia phage RSP15]BAU40044.1 hypothetical protein [Ralstonia phage RSP15]